MKAVWTEQALERLQEIQDYSAENNPENAVRFIGKLIDRGDRAAIAPFAGRRVPDIGLDHFREVLDGNYRIVYRIKTDRIEILTVFEGHQQLPIEDI